MSPACPPGRWRRGPPSSGPAPAAAGTRTGRGSSSSVLRAGGTGGTGCTHGWGVTGPLLLLGAEPPCELLAGLVYPISPGATGSGRGDHSRAAGKGGRPGRDPHAPSSVARSPLLGGEDGAGGNPWGPAAGRGSRARLRQHSGGLHTGSCSPLGTLALSALLLALFSPAGETGRGGLFPPHLSLLPLPGSPSPCAAVSHWSLPPPNAACGFLALSCPQCWALRLPVVPPQPHRAGAARPRCRAGAPRPAPPGTALPVQLCPRTDTRGSQWGGAGGPRVSPYWRRGEEEPGLEVGVRDPAVRSARLGAAAAGASSATARPRAPGSIPSPRADVGEQRGQAEPLGSGRPPGGGQHRQRGPPRHRLPARGSGPREHGEEELRSPQTAGQDEGGGPAPAGGEAVARPAMPPRR